MPSPQLLYTLTCEKYSDGSSYTINYEEIRNDPEMMEQGSPEGSGAVRTFLVKWQDRFNFIENMCGFAKVSPATGPIPADSSGFNGKHIHRKLPVGWDMGFYNTSGNPESVIATDIVSGGSTLYDTPGWVFPLRWICTPVGEKTTIKYVDGTYGPAAEFAKIQFTYSALDYDLFNDTNAVIYRPNYSLGRPDVSTMYEYNRYGRIVQKPASIFYQSPSTFLHMVDYPDASSTLALTQRVYPDRIRFLDNIADFWVYIYDIPYDPIVGVNNCFGKVNKYSIFATPDFTTGQPPETLHFISADILRLPLRMGRRYWNLILGFRKVFNTQAADGSGGGGTTNILGHNFFRWFSKPNDTTSTLKFYRLSVDGTDSLAKGNPVIDVEDFGKLFWIP